MTVGGVALLAVLWLDIGADSDADALRLEPRWTEELPSEARVRYRLDCGYSDRTWTNDYQQSHSRFAIDLTQGGVPNLFTVRAEVCTAEGTKTYASVNTNALVWIPLAEAVEHRRIPVLFEQPGPTAGSGIAIDTLLKCNSPTAGEVFWVLEQYGRPMFGWRVDADGRFCELDRYRIQRSGWERREYEAPETILPAGWMLKPEGTGPEVKGFWICGQYLDRGAAQQKILSMTQSKPYSWNPDGVMYFSVPYVEGLAPTNVVVQVERTAAMDYLLPSGESGTLTTTLHYRWEPRDSLPWVLDRDGDCVRGFPLGTVYHMVHTNNRWFVHQGEYSPKTAPEFKWLPRICISTTGPDCYDDGTPVLDGECYAVVKVSAPTARIAFTADGRLVDPTQRLIAVLPLAQDGRLPETVLEFDSAIPVGELEGDYCLCLLDTRVDAQHLAPLNGENPMPSRIGSCCMPRPTAEGVLPSFAVTAAANFAACGGCRIWRPLPQIGSFAVTATNILMTVENMDPDSEYFVVPAKSIDAFEEPLPDRPVGNVFNLRKQDGYRFFKIVRQPKAL